VIHVLSVSYKLLTEFTKEVVTKNGVEERLTVEYADYIKNSDFDIVINLLAVPEIRNSDSGIRNRNDP
jgi:hypothetical protein